MAKMTWPGLEIWLKWVDPDCLIGKMKYINVVIDNKADQTDSYFTYKAPDEVQVGAKLTVSFGTRKKLLDAYCVETDVVTDYDPARIKSIEAYDSERSLTSEIIETARWMRNRYGVKYIDAIKMFTVNGKRANANVIPGLTLTSANDNANINPGLMLTSFELTAEQKNAVAIINSSIEGVNVNVKPGIKLADVNVKPGMTLTYLIKGVTNSGKTEVYMEAVKKTLELGKTAIVLLPEIALAGQVEQRFIERFGEQQVATLHSKLSTSKKLEEWLRIRRGEAKIVVGARTSVFAPLENIGVIVIDEEHESTYKSDHNPKFETVDVAYKRAALNGATLILGSATPSVVSYYRAKQGIYKLIEMNHRVGDSIMPELEIVDMKEEVRNGNSGVVSSRLALEVTKALKRKEQVILFLNRRGFSTHIMCPDCGYVMTCEDCGITMTYHKAVNAAVCHYCGKKKPIPKICPDCGSKFMKFVGAGTEKVEEAVQSLWPEAAIDRFDLDTAKSQAEIKNTIKNFQKGKTDILVGTQILAKGLDFRNVGLVGIMNADIGLNIPDYRSSERTYQLITQVAGRAGRAGGSSKVLIQTYEPDSDVIRQAAEGDYEAFYEAELLHRNVMNYPPFSDIINISFTEKKAQQDAADEEESSAMRYANHFREVLRNMKGMPEGSVILKPVEEDRRIEGRRRVSFLIKAPLGSRSGYLKAYLDYRDVMRKTNADCYIEIDVNPY